VELASAQSPKIFYIKGNMKRYYFSYAEPLASGDLFMSLLQDFTAEGSDFSRSGWRLTCPSGQDPYRLMSAPAHDTFGAR
jgi:hypothetical protein